MSNDFGSSRDIQMSTPGKANGGVDEIKLKMIRGAAPAYKLQNEPKNSSIGQLKLKICLFNVLPHQRSLASLA